MDTAVRPTVIHVLSIIHIHSAAHLAEKSSHVVIGVLDFVISATIALPVSSLARESVVMVIVNDHATVFATHVSSHALGRLIVLTKFRVT